MTDTKVGPFIVERPHNTLTATHDFIQSFERKHPLIDPVQMDDVCLLEFLGMGDVYARIGNVRLPKTGT